MEIIVERLANLVDCIIVVYLFNTLFESKRQEKSVRWIQSLVFLVLLYIDSRFASDVKSNAISVLVMMLISFVYCAVALKGNVFLKGIISVIYPLIIALCSGIAMSFTGFFLSIDRSGLLQPGTYQRYVLLLTNKALQVILVVLVVYMLKRQKHSALRRGWVLLLTLYIGSYMLIGIYWQIMWGDRASGGSNIFLAVLILLNVFIFLIYKGFASLSEKEKALEILEKEYQIQKNMIEEMKSNYEESIRIRHDIKNYLLVTNSYLARGEIEKAIKYNSEWSGDLFAGRFIYFDTGSMAVDAILCDKFSKCKDRGIDYKCEITVNMSVFDQANVAILLANLLDNAIEASQEVEEPYIYLKISGKMAYVVLSVENKINAPIVKKDGQMLSTKRNKEMPGIGLKSIKRAVEQMNGQMKMEEEEQFVRFVIYFSM